MARVSDIVSALEEYAPPAYAIKDDNSGLLVGRASAKLSAVLVTLDITGEAVAEAVRLGAGLIVSHHPVFFSVRRITDESPEGIVILDLAEKGVAAICMHTNLDFAQGGVNYSLLKALDMPEPYTPISPIDAGREKNIGEGLVSELPKPEEIGAFAAQVKIRLGCKTIRCHPARPVKRVGFCSGSGGSVFRAALRAGCDTFVTGDCKHSLFIEAKVMGANLIDAGHFRTEDVICAPIASFLSERFPGTAVYRSKACKEPFICL